MFLGKAVEGEGYRGEGRWERGKRREGRIAAFSFIWSGAVETVDKIE